LQVGGDGEPAERGLAPLDEHADGPDEAVSPPGAERDDAVGGQVLLELLERLGQRRDVRVAVLLRLRDEGGTAQREQLPRVVDGDRADVEGGHGAMVSAGGTRALLSDLVSPTSPVDPTHLVLTLSCPDRPGIVAAV